MHFPNTAMTVDGYGRNILMVPDAPTLQVTPSCDTRTRIVGVATGLSFGINLLAVCRFRAIGKIRTLQKELAMVGKEGHLLVG